VGFRPSVESIDRHRVFDSVNDQMVLLEYRVGWVWFSYGENAGRSVGRSVDNVFEEQLELPAMCPLCPSQNLRQRRLVKSAAPENLNLIKKSLAGA
jgi:hypothetical protein